MRSYKIQLLLLIPCFFVANGCFYKAQKTTEQKENILPVKVIAVLPVKSKSNQNMATPELLRKKLCDELHFRGYDTIPLSALDEKLNAVHPSSDPMTSTKFSVQSLPEFFEFDAVMDCKLLQDSHKKSFFYSPIIIEAKCELRRKTTDELLWSGQEKAQNRNFDLTPKGIERKIYEDYENIVAEVVDKLLEKLPDGPNLR
ncbi:MAG TPA: hypothetical protein PLT45_00215 [Smithella sp.]|nr:hypothetical protein [Smithella sp.]